VVKEFNDGSKFLVLLTNVPCVGVAIYFLLN